MGSRRQAGRIFATAVSKDESRGRAIVFRFVREFESGFERSRLPVRVILAWRYDSEDGMPAHAERVRMDRMEDLLEPHVEAAGGSVLALVSTGENLREWTYYARSESGFLAQLNAALRGQLAFPIEIHTAP